MKKKIDFFNRVYKVVEEIPRGKVTTYGAIAKFLGAGKSARVVGWAMNHAHNLPNKIPAHRVVNGKGILTGKYHFEKIDTMEKLLNADGITIKNDKIINFSSLFWNPNEHLDFRLY